MLLAVLTALAVITLRLILYYSGSAPAGTDFLIVHFLALVTVVFFMDHRLLGADRRTPFPTLMREGFKSAAVYALLIAVFIWFYFTSVDEHHFTQRVNDMVAKAVASGQSEQAIRPKLEQFFTPFNYTTITFFALLISGAINALLIAILHHKVLRRFRR